MMSQKKKRLGELRARLHIKLKAQDFLEKQLAPYTEILALLQQENVAYNIVALLGFQEKWHPYLEEELQKPTYSPLKISLGKSNPQELLNTLFLIYPSIHALRYVPPIEKMELTPDPRET